MGPRSAASTAEIRVASIRSLTPKQVFVPSVTGETRPQREHGFPGPTPSSARRFPPGLALWKLQRQPAQRLVTPARPPRRAPAEGAAQRFLDRDLGGRTAPHIERGRDPRVRRQYERNRMIARRGSSPAALSRKWRRPRGFVAHVARGVSAPYADRGGRATEHARIRVIWRTDRAPVGVERNRRSPLSRGEPTWALSPGAVAGDLRR
jgi:hypothetical protein